MAAGAGAKTAKAPNNQASKRESAVVDCQSRAGQFQIEKVAYGIAMRRTFRPIRATILVDDWYGPPRAGEIHAFRCYDPGVCSEGGIGSGAGGSRAPAREEPTIAARGRAAPAGIGRAPLPERCPCGGPAVKDQVKPQYQEEIVRQKIVRQFDVEIGHCACCGKRLQGRHGLQTSDGLDAAQVQLRPEALTLAVHLTKQLGSPMATPPRLCGWGMVCRRAAEGLCRAAARLGKKVGPTYQAILPGRGLAQASTLIGADYAGG
jgi:hypothetical protein